MKMAQSMNKGRAPGGDLPVLFLDFDGVICDSLPECVRTAYAVYEHISGCRHCDWQRSDILQVARQLRPFALSGEDFCVFPYLIETAQEVRNQEAFWAAKERYSSILPASRELFYRIRAATRQTEPATWFALNPLYPTIDSHIRRLAAAFDIYIVTTKDEPSVVALLGQYNIDIPAHRIYGRERGASKSETIHLVMRETAAPLAVFLEDSVQQLLRVCHPRVLRYLALWGYVDPEYRRLARPSEIFAAHLSELSEQLTRAAMLARESL